MQIIWCFVAEVEAMINFRNWSREVGDCGNTSDRPSQESKPSPGRVLAADWEGSVLPQSPTSHDQSPLHHKAYKTIFGQVVCFKWRHKLSCCCNNMDGATIRTTYNNRISYCWRHVHVWRSHCWGTRLFSIITSSFNNGSITYAHASTNSKYDDDDDDN